ncbi:MAG: tetratricopeptide repeat protein, partial [Bacteroidales bacterium]|nr:tetratricopeptide repeat protein [Bacteroidales bacterium]
MKKVLLGVLTFVLVINFVVAQDKTAKDFKIEAAEAYNAKEYAKGLDAFEQSIRLYEANGATDTTLYFNAGVCAYKIKDYDKAVSHFSRSIDLQYKTCNSMLFKSNSLKKLEKYKKMEELCNKGINSCPKSKDKFSDILFNHYRKQGLAIYNGAAQIQSKAAPYIESDKARYDAEMGKAKIEFQRAL